MVKYLNLLILFISVFNIHAQFSQPNALCNLETSPQGASCAITADIDNDGDLDVVTASFSDNKIAWSENLGNNRFSLLNEISNQSLGARFVCAGDMDGDGDLDIMAASSNDNTISYFENLGNANFNTEQIISSNAFGARIVRVEDLDNDGDLDVVSGSYGDDKIAWYENLGTGNFSGEQIVTTAADQVSVLAIDDMDSDGDMDIITNHLNTLAYYENNGTGNFGAINYTGMSSIGVVDFRIYDIDNNGEKDIIVAKSGTENKVSVLPNLGSGNFGAEQVIYSSFSGNLSTVALGDIDGDADPDIVFGFSQPYEIGKIINLGLGTFSTGQIILEYPAGRLEMYDFNSDGFDDILSSSVYADKVSWYENTNGSSYSNQIVIGSAVQSYGLVLADIDNDGFKDIFYTSYSFSEVGWFPHLSNGIYGNMRTVSSTVDHIKSVYYGDFDNDGLIDIITASKDDNTIAWFRNESQGHFGTKNIISTNALGASDVYSADLDNDGDIDVISASESDNKIAWYENLGGGLFSSGVVISSIANGAQACFGSDLDNDGDIDVISASGYDDKIAWYENLGGGNFSTQNIITTLTDYPREVMAADLDSDGDQDVISVTYSDNQLAWYENLGGGAFGSQQVLFNGLSGLISVTVNDFDYDVDLDILVPDGAGGIYYLENLGNANFGAPVSAINAEAWSVITSGDLDNDGDHDVVYGSQTNWSVNTVKNLLFEPYQVRGKLFYDENLNGIFDSNDYGLNNVKVLTNPQDAFSFTYGNGNYIVNFDSTLFGNYEVFPEIENYWNFTTDSLLYHVNVDSAFGFADSLDFGIYPDSLFYSFVTELSGGFPLCNSINNYWLNSVNVGTLPTSGVFHLILDDEILFQTAPILPDSISGSNYYWSFDSLNCFEDGLLNIHVQMPDFTFMGDTLISYLEVMVFDSLGNLITFPKDTLNQILVCAYDPNDKAVQPKGLDSTGFIPLNTPGLEYIIRFQNTGTDTAKNVIIKDQLSENLDWYSMQVTSFSHDVQTSVSNSGIVSFEFENIMLPDSNVNEPGSHGFVKFIINPVNNLTSGAMITNKADIYFDFNPAIITNTVTNTLYDCGDVYENLNFQQLFCLNDTIRFEISDSTSNSIYTWIYEGMDTTTSQVFIHLADSVGNNSLSLSIENEFCQADSVVNIVINQPPIVTIENSQFDSLCTQDNPVQLIVSPPGGFFSGDGIIGNSFDPSILSTGLHQITYSFINENLCSSSDTIFFFLFDCLSVFDSEDLGFICYPNPTENLVFVECSENIELIGVYDVNGRMIRVEKTAHSNKKIIDLSNSESGIYILEIVTANGNVFRTEIIKNR